MGNAAPTSEQPTMSQQQQAPSGGLQIINNFFGRAPEPVKPATLQKREAEGARSAQVQAEEELARQEKRLAQQEQQLEKLKGQIRAYAQAGQQPPGQMVQRARLLQEDLTTMQQLLDNLRRQCLQVDKAQTASRVVRLQEQLTLEKQQALQGVSEGAVQRTNVQSRATDKRIDRVFDRLTGTQHLDAEELSTANDAFLADLMREPVTTNEPLVVRTPNNTNTVQPQLSYVKGSNRTVDEILRL